MNPNAFPIPVLDVPRVELPGVDRASADALRTEMDSNRRLRWLFSLAMVKTGKHIYARTVPAATVARRRAANKAARIARRAAR